VFGLSDVVVSVLYHRGFGGLGVRHWTLIRRVLCSQSDMHLNFSVYTKDKTLGM
jgi:hypothetical protein